MALFKLHIIFLMLKLLSREVNGLLKTAKFLKAEKLQIVTRNEERTVEQDGFIIEVIPVWKWVIMLENNN